MRGRISGNTYCCSNAPMIAFTAASRSAADSAATFCDWPNADALIRQHASSIETERVSDVVICARVWLTPLDFRKPLQLLRELSQRYSARVAFDRNDGAIVADGYEQARVMNGRDSSVRSQSRRSSILVTKTGRDAAPPIRASLLIATPASPLPWQSPPARKSGSPRPPGTAGWRCPGSRTPRRWR